MSNNLKVDVTGAKVLFKKPLKVPVLKEILPNQSEFNLIKDRASTTVPFCRPIINLIFWNLMRRLRVLSAKSFRNHQNHNLALSIQTEHHSSWSHNSSKSLQKYHRFLSRTRESIALWSTEAASQMGLTSQDVQLIQWLLRGANFTTINSKSLIILGIFRRLSDIRRSKKISVF